MSAELGMIPEEFGELASQLDANAGGLDGVVSTLTSNLQGTTWVGSDCNRFDEERTGTITQNVHNSAEQISGQ
ncbi:hypothetical protein [Salinibacterium sp. SWN1162]|uniref:hypothetical protein n=1 Tax=Salinibacterium sp. SWN1162 TaxID=2792053 RepID=UPI0018CD6EE9|nr:hypothetical protein [Salinibacterium sp. SWN1162]MBH0008850.1 hypothetical protein [Salinibacterium sp. SWN1162]